MKKKNTFSAVRGCRRFNLETKFSKLEGTVIVLYKEELNIIPEDEEKITKLRPSPSQSTTKRNCEKYISSTFYV